MKIYITEEIKKELDAKIAELENELQLIGNLFENRAYNHKLISAELRIRKEILSQAIILPEEESWTKVLVKTSEIDSIRNLFPNGVIIKNKES